MNNFSSLPQIPPVAALILFSWSILWKGLALWRAAQNTQKNWFIALLVLNTVGILEIVYLFKFAKNKLTLEELKSIIKLNK